MADIAIVTDASCDLDPAVLDENGIEVIPMEYMVNGAKKVFDGKLSQADEAALAKAQMEGELTQTSQITPFAYSRFFESLLKEGKSILYIALSSGLSSTYQSSLMAKEELAETYPDLDIECVDSLGATGGMGVLVEKAIANRKAGMSLKENAEDIRKASHVLDHWFMVPDLNYLRKGGRVSAAAAAIGSLLDITPVLEVDKTGHLVPIAKKRGKRNALKELFRQFETHFVPGVTDVVYIGQTSNVEFAKELRAMVVAAHPNLTIRMVGCSPIIAAHTGQGLVVIAHLGK